MASIFVRYLSYAKDVLVFYYVSVAKYRFKFSFPTQFPLIPYGFREKKGILAVFIGETQHFEKSLITWRPDMNFS